MDEGDSRGEASLRELCEGNLVGGLHYWEPREDMQKNLWRRASP